MFIHVSVLKVELADKSWTLSSYTWFCDWFSQAEHTSRAHLCCIKAAFDLLGPQRSFAVMQSHREVMREVMMLFMIALERCPAWNRILIPFWIKNWSRSFPMTSILAYWHLLPLTVLWNIVYDSMTYDLTIRQAMHCFIVSSKNIVAENHRGAEASRACIGHAAYEWLSRIRMGREEAADAWRY